MTLELLGYVRAAVAQQTGIFGVDEISSLIERHYDPSLIREAIWLLIDRGEVDLAYPCIGFVKVSKEDDDADINEG